MGLRTLPRNILQIGRGYLAGRQTIRHYRPDVLFFTGGYVAVPVALAGWFYRYNGQRPCNVLYIPDIEPGLALKVLSRLADRIALTVEDSMIYFSNQSKLMVSGYPTRPDLRAWSLDEARKVFDLSPDYQTLLVFGGSKGAHSINQEILRILPQILIEMQVIHISGHFDWPIVEKMKKFAGRWNPTALSCLPVFAWRDGRGFGRYGYGADADHLKVAADIDLCLGSGYTLFTFDPGDHVDNSAANDVPRDILRKLDALPWELLGTTPSDLRSRLVDKPIDLGYCQLTISMEDLLRAAAKYGPAVAHTSRMYRHLAQAAGARPFEVEVSIDETGSVTTLEEHVYIATELKRLGVTWVSLAPRYVGSFEKGVDFIGDPAEFDQRR